MSTICYIVVLFNYTVIYKFYTIVPPCCVYVQGLSALGNDVGACLLGVPLHSSVCLLHTVSSNIHSIGFSGLNA